MIRRNPSRTALAGLLALGAVLLLALPPAAPASERTLDLGDILRLHEAGVSDDIVMSEVVVTGSVFALDVDDILRLKEAGVSDRLLQFLVDTGRTDDGASWSGDEPSTEASGSHGTEGMLDVGDAPTWAESDDDWSDDGSYADTWQNVIVEDPPSVTYNVTLRWGYPDWWYDAYWDDYWGWDFRWDPYRVSWVYDYGCWYPGWYTRRVVWVYPAWGYNRWCHSHWGWGGYGYAGGGWATWHDGYLDGYWDGYYDGRDAWYGSGGTRRLSDSKRKTGHTGSGKGGLHLPVGPKLTREKRREIFDRPTVVAGARLPVDRPTKGGDVRRPTRTIGRTPVEVRSGGDPPVRTPDRSTRLDGRRPVRVRPTPVDGGIRPPDRPTRPVVRKPDPGRSRVTEDRRTVDPPPVRRPSISRPAPPSPPPTRSDPPPAPPERPKPRVEREVPRTPQPPAPPPEPKRPDAEPKPAPKVEKRVPEQPKPAPQRPSAGQSRPAPRAPKDPPAVRSGGGKSGGSGRTTPRKPSPKKPRGGRGRG